MIGDAVRSILIADATLTGLVGDNIYMVRVPQKKNPPQVVLLVAGVDPEICKTPGNRYDDISLTILVMSLKYKELNQISEQIRTVLEGYAGVSESKNLNIDYGTESDNYDDKAKLYVRNMSFNVTYTT